LRSQMIFFMAITNDDQYKTYFSKRKTNAYD